MTDEELVEYLKTEGYSNLRILEDGIIGTIDMLFTRALVIDLQHHGYSHRYCYENRIMADIAAQTLVKMEDEPLAGYTVRK